MTKESLRVALDQLFILEKNLIHSSQVLLELERCIGCAYGPGRRVCEAIRRGAIGGFGNVTLSVNNDCRAGSYVHPICAWRFSAHALMLRQLLVNRTDGGQLLADLRAINYQQDA